jgi:hypothetical protein
MSVPLSVWDPVKRCRVLNPKAFEPMTEPKTTLAPNAPWPGNHAPKPPVVVRKRKLPPPKNASKIKRTDENFERWAAKNLGENYGK